MKGNNCSSLRYSFRTSTKTPLNYIPLLFLLSFLVACNNTPKKEPTQTVFGQMNETDSLDVELKVSDFDDFDDLLIRSEQIVCNDSFPKIVIRKEHEVKTIYLWQLCRKNYGCILPPKMRNRFEIHNDSVLDKINGVYQPLDSLEHFLERDINNQGKNPKLSDNPMRLRFKVYYENHSIDSLPNTLDKLTSFYEKITNKRGLLILFYKPLPPPPVHLDQPTLMK